MNSLFFNRLCDAALFGLSGSLDLLRTDNRFSLDEVTSTRLYKATNGQIIASSQLDFCDQHGGKIPAVLSVQIRVNYSCVDSPFSINDVQLSSHDNVLKLDKQLYTSSLSTLMSVRLSSTTSPLT